MNRKSKNSFSVLVLMQFIFINNVLGQTDEFLEKRADRLHKNKLFFLANDIYRNLYTIRKNDISFVLKRAITEWETNHLDTATALIQQILLAKQKPDLTYLLQGKILMAQNKYEQAAKEFKNGLAIIAQDSKERPLLIEEIKRCGVGIKLSNASELALVESAGTTVNTPWDEVTPIYSINQDMKFYFSSNRQAVESFEGDIENYEAPFDIYSTALENGEWADINPINEYINSKSHEVLLGFNETGQVLYFKSGNKLDQMNFKTDTFSNDGSIRKPGEIEIPGLQPNDQVCFFSDSFALISSNRPGGLGGYDIYFTQKKQQGWTPFENIGIAINTPYDEVSPYLAYDGRTLLFSSNSTKSSGGFDIFLARFSDKDLSWEIPMNVGWPINSAGDDKHFVMNKNRLGGIFSSNRKSGVGGYDIYIAYFKNAWVPQSERSNPIVFAEVLNKKVITQSIITEQPASPDIVLDNYDINYLNLEQLRLPAITSRLQQIKKILDLNPSLLLVAEVFSDAQNKTKNQAYLQSLQVCEEVKKNLSALGVKSSRISTRAYGAEFNAAMEKLNNEINPAGISVNKRIEFTFYTQELKSNEIIQQSKNVDLVNELMAIQGYKNMRLAETSLNYKLLLVSIANLSLLEPYLQSDNPPFYIEKNLVTGKYDLISAGFKDFATANAERKKWKEAGFDDVVVVPFYKNQRLINAQLKNWAEKYPDLSNYIYRGE